jgi:glycine/D-amino acid oxidase-like deaminating enzyme
MPCIDHVTSSPVLPKRASAVVIGAGVIGISTALSLQDMGLDVVVVEKGEVAAEQSSRNWGWCRQMGRDPREIPLIKVSLDLWRGMNARIGAETGYRTCGIVYLSETEAQLADKISWVEDHAKPHGLSTEIMTPARVAELTPGSTLPFKGGIYTADDGRAEPFIAVQAMARFFQSRGGVIITQCAARGIETSGGHVSAVVTEKASIATDTVIAAGGYWSSRFLHNLDIRFPQLGVISSVARTPPLDIGHEHTFSGHNFAVRKRLDGGFTVAHNIYSVADLTPLHVRFMRDFLPLLMLDKKSVKIKVGNRFVSEWQMKRRWQLDEVTPFEQHRILDPAPYPALLDDCMEGLRRVFPAFADVPVVEQWAGMIDATPDAVPVIDALDKVPGLYLASGFSGHGFGLGPGAGLLMAQLVTGATPCVDPTPFRFKRFEDGSRPLPTTGL